MYIIENGEAYLVDGEVAYFVNFATTGKMLIDKEKTIEVEGKSLYTFEEMYAKLNIAYKIEEAIKEKAMSEVENEIIDELNKKVAELEKENKELQEIIKSLETTDEVEKDENKDEATDEEPKVEKEEKKSK